MGVAAGIWRSGKRESRSAQRSRKPEKTKGPSTRTYVLARNDNAFGSLTGGLGFSDAFHQATCPDVSAAVLDRQLCPKPATSRGSQQSLSRHREALHRPAPDAG